MSLVTLIQTTSETLKSISEINSLKNKIAEADKISAEQFQIDYTIRGIRSAGDLAQHWMTPEERKTIALELKMWAEYYGSVDTDMDGVVTYQNHHRRLQRIKEIIKNKWKTYAEKEYGSVKDLSGFLITHIKLHERDKDELRDRLSQLASATTKFPSRTIVTEFIDNINVINQHLLTSIPHPAVQAFIRKAQDGAATAVDLTPEVLNWFREQGGLSQLKITLG